jgi:hypothetical protein
MIMRFVVPAMAAAALGLLTASAFAAQAQSAAKQSCAALESQVDRNLPMAQPGDIGKATAERAQGAKLCNSGKTEQGMAKLQQALTTALGNTER